MRAACTRSEQLQIAAEPHVRGERGALERAIANLLENAHLHGRGTVTVGLTQEGQTAVLSVADEGPGPADPQAAFARFWRAPEATERPGSGLGLSIVAATATRHGGRVTVAGSRFTLELPILRTLSEQRPRLAGNPIVERSPR
ncbi:MAG: hypothetical protein NVSMB51_17880 [Solirubrobacteraceae bacterium]